MGTFFGDYMRARGGVLSCGFKTSTRQDGPEVWTAIATHRETGEVFEESSHASEISMMRLADKLLARRRERLKALGIPDDLIGRIGKAGYALSVSEAGFSAHRAQPGGKSEEWLTVPFEQGQAREAVEHLAETLKIDLQSAAAERAAREKKEAYERYLRELKPFSRGILARLKALGVEHVVTDAFTREEWPFLDVTPDEAAEIILAGWNQVCQTAGRLGVGPARDYSWLMACAIRRLGRAQFLESQAGHNKAWLKDLEIGDAWAF